MPAIYSMTAFARRESSHDWGSLAWELRSVNHRYLETQQRMPDTLRQLETPVRELLRARLARGKVDCSLRLSLDENAGGGIALDEKRIQRLLQACQRVAELGAGTSTPSSLDILRWPGVVAEHSPDMDAVSSEAMRLLEDALAELGAMRAREGARLAEFLEQRLQQIDVIVAAIRVQLPQILGAQKERLRERVAELGGDPDPARLEQEIVLLAAKSDVAEELDRLAAHVEETRRSLEEGGSCGRRLDFLMQEFNREANTLSSKSIATSTTQHAIELKVLIEQMREQVQNIE